MSKILAFIGTAVTVFLIGAIFVLHSQEAAQNRSLQRSTDLVKALQSANKQISAHLSNLDNEVSQINVPTDPLSAYNDICSSPVTNQSTGNVQTYYYPCTNNAQTIPEPGN